MNRTEKSIFSLIIAVAMVFTALPMSALAANDNDPTLGQSGTITGFDYIEPIEVEKGTAQAGIPFPATVTAAVLLDEVATPSQTQSETISVSVAVGEWRLAFGTYDPDAENTRYVFEAVRESLALPDGVVLPDDFAELPCVAVDIGEVEIGIAAVANETTADNVKASLDTAGATTVTVNGNIVTFSAGTATIIGNTDPAPVLTIPAGITLIIDGGELNVETSGGTGVQNNGTLTLTSGTLKVANSGSCGLWNVGTLNISGGTVDIENTDDTVGISNEPYSVASVIDITGGTVNIANSDNDSFGIINNSAAADNRGQLNISSSADINIANAAGIGIFNKGKISISGGDAAIENSAGTGISNNTSFADYLCGEFSMTSGTLTVANTGGTGISVPASNAGPAIFKVTGGTVTGASGSTGNITLGVGSKVTALSGTFNDRDTSVTATSEITIGAATNAASASGLSAGIYTWDGTSFKRPSGGGTTYTVTFNAQGGTVSPTSATTGTDGKLASLPTPTRTGYTFSGWFDAATGGTAITTSTVFTANTTIYAQWATPTPTPTPSGGSSGGGSSKQDSTPAPNPWLEPTPAQSLASGTNKAQQDAVRTKSTDTYGVRKASWQKLKGYRYYHDTMEGNAVQVRLYIDNPAAMNRDIYISGFVKGSFVDNRKAKFEKWFTNQIRVIHMDEAEPWGQEVQIAAKVDLANMDTKNLYFYSYDKKTNKYTRITEPRYWIDKSGYLHFYTELAGDIVISEGPLEKR